MSVHDEPIGRSVDETMRLLESAQFAAANKVKSVFQGLDPPFTHARTSHSPNRFENMG